MHLPGRVKTVQPSPFNALRTDTLWSSIKWHLPLILVLVGLLFYTQPAFATVKPAKKDLYRLTEQVADEMGLDRQLLKALVMTESSYNPNTVSKTGAMGLMQLMPLTAKDMGVANPYDPEQNLRGGAKYLKMLLKRFDSLVLALAAYNAGPGNVERYGTIPPFAQTRRYVQKVLTHYGKFRQAELALKKKKGTEALGSWDLALADLAVLSREIERMDKLSRKQAAKKVPKKAQQVATTPKAWQRTMSNPEPPRHLPAPSEPISLVDGLVTFQKLDGVGQRKIQVNVPTKASVSDSREARRTKRLAQERARIEARRAQLESRKRVQALKRKKQLEALAERRAKTAALREANRARAQRLSLKAKQKAYLAAQQRMGLSRAGAPAKRESIKLTEPTRKQVAPIQVGKDDGQSLRSYRKADGSLVFTTQPPTEQERQEDKSANVVTLPSVKPAKSNGRTLGDYQRRQRSPSMPSKREGIHIRGSS
ncbi:transglycosylase SLT domain-containing protein [Magnetococcus sp. PR-3]|uniref:transglycosylase SLT domain-containing protein n=1 Tax=Magnetococcus sp. PR-3 TaxID=3120355 RepID=UPI002FCE0042